MVVSATSKASLNDGARPPTAGEAAPPLDVAGIASQARPTAGRRPDITPARWPVGSSGAGFATDDPYVRRFWTAAIGQGAVADLMRLAVAAKRDRSLLLPESLGILLREDLARWVNGKLFVRVIIPPLAPAQERRLSPGLKREHRDLASVATWTIED